MLELRFNQNMFNPHDGIITTEVDYGTFTHLRDKYVIPIAMRSEHTSEVRVFYWNDKSGLNKLYYYNEDMDIYLCVRTAFL